jgi:hypothetical protein
VAGKNSAPDFTGRINHNRKLVKLRTGDAHAAIAKESVLYNPFSSGS